MKHQSLRQEFAKYVSLNIFGMIGVSCYILADTFFIARGVGSAGLTALNLAIPAYSLMHGIGLMIGIGGATRYSVCRAQNDTEEADRIFTHAAFLALLVGILALIIGAFAAGPLSRLLGADDQTFFLTSNYLRILLCFGPAFVLNDVLTAFVRNDGAPRLAMMAMLIGSLTNIVLDYVLVFPCGLGIFGAALATGLSPIIGIIVLSFHLRSDACRFRLEKQKIRPRLFSALCMPGISTLINELSTGFVLLMFNLVILRLAGNIGVAAYGVVANVAIVGVSIFTGIAQGTQPLVSSYYGRGETHTLHRLFRYALMLSLIIATALYLVIFLWAEPLTAAFNSEGDPVLTSFAVKGLRIYFLGFWCAGVNIISSAYFSAIEQTRQGFVLSLLRGLIANAPILLILASVFHMNGVWATFPAVELVTALVTVLFSIRHFKKQA